MARLSLMLTLLVVSAAHAQWSSIQSVDSVAIAGNHISVYAGRSVVHVTMLAEDLVRIRASRNGQFVVDKSVAVVKTDWSLPSMSVDQTPADINVKSSKVWLRIKKQPLRLVFMNAKGEVVNEDDPAKGMAWDGEEIRISKKKPDDEFYYGLGEKAGVMNRTGKSYTMWNSDIPAYRADTDPLYQTVPFFFGIHRGTAYGIFFDNSYWSSFDFGKESPDRYSFGAAGGEINYYFFAGPDPKNILARFTELVGRMPLPPRWSLGYQQCRWSYSPESRVRSLASTFRKKKIPCDVIYLDIDYMEGYRIFTWNKKNFPDPKRMIKDLAGQGFKIAVIVDPGIKVDSSYAVFTSGRDKDVFLKYPDGAPFIGTVWPGNCAFPDFSSPSARKWWGENFSGLVDAGVKGFWNDMNEPSVFDGPNKTVPLHVLHADDGLNTLHTKNHNTYGMQMTKATYDGVRNFLPNERLFLLTRASYAGGQRYSAAWTGDNASRWDNLEMAVSMSLSVGLSGQPFIGSDIGGFIGVPSAELFTRWLQLGVFTPLMRGHSVINSPDKEPWSFGPRHEKINREVIELRYKLLPYIYNSMVQASQSGIPAMRPMLLEYPDDAAFVGEDTQFLFGDDLLIAPVLWPGDTTREVQLPKGNWYDFWTETKFEGGKRIVVPAPIDRIPVFVRAGAIVPTQQLVQYSDQSPINPLSLTVYPAQVSSAVYYEDDGKTLDFEKGVYFQRDHKQTRSDDRLTLELSNSRGTYVPSPRSLHVRFVDVPFRPSKVFVSGTEIGSNQWTYDRVARSVTVRVKDTVASSRLELVW